MEGIKLLVSDLDGTLLGDDEALAQFARWYDEYGANWRLAYNSGRFFESVRETIRSTALPSPDAIIGGVGTEIRSYPEAVPVADDWPEPISGWDRRLIVAVLAGFRELEMQPDECQSEYKLSYFGNDLSDKRLATMRGELSQAGQEVNVVYSSSRDLDVLPLGVDKGTATARLASCWNLEPWQVFVAGDSGNDSSMFAQGFRGIVVGNAHEVLRQIESPAIYHANRPFAGGVQEGLEFWLTRSHVSVNRC